ncbi:MAG: CUB domain-containing protein, partial [Bacteroidia bacterium]
MKKNLLLTILLLPLIITLHAQNYNMGNSSVSTCAGTFYDNGGGGAYGNNQNLTMTFCSNVSGNCIRISFNTFNIENGYDYLTIYDGANTAAPILGSFTGTGNPGVFTGTSGCLTFVFTSDISIVMAGWNATVTCVACSAGGPCGVTCSGGPAPANDACSGAQNLGAIPVPAACPNGVGAWANFATSNLCATAENPYTTLTGCQPAGNMASPAADVWYRFTITAPTLNINISGLQSPNVGLYAGTACNNLIGRGCAIGGAGNLSTTFGGLAPGTYYLQVSGGNLNDQCNFNLGLQNNYDCAGCVIASSFTAVP